MNKILLFILLPAGIFLLMSCAKVDEQERENVGTLTLPIASFYVSGNEGSAPATVQFHNTSEYSDQWVWTFHNGSTSGQFEPTYTYYNNSNEDKTFLVTLKAIDSNTGEYNIRSKSILIHPSK